MISNNLNNIIGKICKLEYIKSIYSTKIQKFERNDYIMMPNSPHDFFRYFNSYEQLNEKFFSVYKNVDIYEIDRGTILNGNIIEFTISDISKEKDFSIIKSNNIIISGVILTGIETSDPEESSIKSIIGVTPKIIENNDILQELCQLNMTLCGYNKLYDLFSSKDEIKL